MEGVAKRLLNRDLAEKWPWSQQWYIPALIPNDAGVRVTVRLHGGFELVTEVVLRSRHCLRDVPIERVKMWRYTMQGDQDFGPLHNAYILAEEASGKLPSEVLNVS